VLLRSICVDKYEVFLESVKLNKRKYFVFHLVKCYESYCSSSGILRALFDLTHFPDVSSNFAGLSNDSHVALM
jgi:hypothetical protein